MLVSDLLPPVHRGNRQKECYSDDMTQPSKDQSVEIWSKRLIYTAWALWLISLALPGFMADNNGHDLLFGGIILLFGLLFGWYVGGWAAYANIFFVIAALRLHSGRQPITSVFAMLALGATLPLFKGVVLDEGSGAIGPVVSWGWGAGIWLSSLVLLATAAAIRARRLPPIGAKVVMAALLAGFVAVGALHFQQRAAANLQERAFYLSGGMAYTRAPLCGIPLTAVDAALLPPDAIVTRDMDPALADAEKDGLSLPLLPNYQEGDFAWIKVGNWDAKVRVATDLNRPVFQVRKTERGAVVRLLGSPSGPVLYEQESKVMHTPKGDRRYYCPMPDSSPVGYGKNLRRALGQESVSQRPFQRKKLVDEIARTPCGLGAAGKKDGQGFKNWYGEKGLTDWDGRQVIVISNFLRSQAGFCSDSYIVLTHIREIPATGTKEFIPIARVFDRKTLQPVAIYGAGRQCPPSVKCPEVPSEFATGVRISDSGPVIETTAGDLAAPKRLE